MSKRKRAKPTYQPPKNHLIKTAVVAARDQIKNAYDAGELIGFEDGFELAHKIWVTAADNVKGIGPKLEAALIQEARKVMQESMDLRFGKEIRPEVKRVRDYLREQDKNERDNTGGKDNG